MFLGHALALKNVMHLLFLFLLLPMWSIFHGLMVTFTFDLRILLELPHKIVSTLWFAWPHIENSFVTNCRKARC